MEREEERFQVQRAATEFKIESVSDEREEKDDCRDVRGEAEEKTEDKHPKRKEFSLRKRFSEESTEFNEEKNESEKANEEIIVDFREAGIDGRAV